MKDFLPIFDKRYRPDFLDFVGFGVAVIAAPLWLPFFLIGWAVYHMLKIFGWRDE